MTPVVPRILPGDNAAVFRKVTITSCDQSSGKEFIGYHLSSAKIKAVEACRFFQVHVDSSLQTQQTKNHSLNVSLISYDWDFFTLPFPSWWRRKKGDSLVG